MKWEYAPLQTKILKGGWGGKLPTNFSWQGPQSGTSFRTPLKKQSRQQCHLYKLHKGADSSWGKKESSEKDAV